MPINQTDLDRAQQQARNEANLKATAIQKLDNLRYALRTAMQILKEALEEDQRR